MPNRSCSAGLVARPFLGLATGLLVCAVAFAAEAAGGRSVLPILVWLVMPLVLGGASFVVAVAVDLLLRGGRTPPLGVQKPEK